MKKRILSVTAFFIIVLTVISVIFIVNTKENPDNDTFRKQLVELNELQTIAKSFPQEDNAEALNKLTETVNQCRTTLTEAIDKNKTDSVELYILTVSFVCIIFVVIVFLYVYIAILRPFDKMKKYANEIANGNFNIPLNYERSNYFGAFTWAFDNMRKEVITSRQNEKEAVLKNKTVIATISHDIKTPITSIRAYSESLAANQGHNKEKDAKYISVIMRKCDEVTNLTNDLLLHSISDLDKLKMELAPSNIKQLLIDALDNSDTHECHIHYSKGAPDGTVMLDEQRFGQVIENLISNSIKYAGTDIDVTCKIEDDDYIITIRDYGDGIPDENIPFIFGKFYRGANVGDKPGSGLGLYITDYIMKKHNGSVKLFNRADGLEAVLSFPICKK